ncbi:MAG: glucosaminidase domain-containing protein [Bacteroidales bacterium]|nr:glucosaminidase domain-containing protein [Bacteroidales bacterium]
MKILMAVLSVFAMIAADRTPREKYIQQYSSVAVREMRRTGVPASITLAQGMLESRYGLSSLATEANNHFGIKCHNDWEGGRYYHDDDKSSECFRVYRNADESFRDHSDFLRYRDRYKFLFDYPVTDYKSWAEGLRKAGYATDPQYPAKLIRLIEEYDLCRFDIIPEAIEEEIPEAPLSIEKPKIHNVKPSEEYRFPLSRKVYEENGVPFVYSLEGESYQSIAKSNNLFLKELLRFNDLSAEASLEPGTIVYLHAKKSKAPRGLEKYIVEEDGESLREICQRFGVKMSSVIKMNKMTPGGVLRQGDTIKLR